MIKLQNWQRWALGVLVGFILGHLVTVKMFAWAGQQVSY